jgi:hypothetical protein
MVAPSHSAAVSTGHDEPPGMNAFNFLPRGMPPPTSSIICITGKPSRNSYTPGLLMWPVRQVILVPPALGTPSAANAAPPSRRIAGTAQNVSTLLSTVGHWKAPTTAGNGGRMRGIPRLPSSDSSSADSSPHS